VQDHRNKNAYEANRNNNKLQVVFSEYKLKYIIEIVVIYKTEIEFLITYKQVKLID